MTHMPAGERWPDVKAFKIAYRNSEGVVRLSSVIQGPKLTAQGAIDSPLVTPFMRANFVAIYSCQPQP